MVAAISLDGLVEAMTVIGSLNGPLFLNFVKYWLVRHLKEGQVVVMDNLSTHKVKGVEEAISSVGATLMYLPPYSPDDNPIEQMWSKVKEFLRGCQARDHDHLHRAISEAYDMITLEDLRGWFRHCGYRLE